jgi:hypothetical protein
MKKMYKKRKKTKKKKKTREESYSVLKKKNEIFNQLSSKKIKSTKIILKKTKQKERKYVKNDNFRKKEK